MKSDSDLYTRMHEAADRVALEASRKASSGDEASDYIKVYKKVFEYLESEHGGSEVTED